MNFELIGRVIEKYDTAQVSDRFKKRDFVIEVENERNSDWNDFVKFQLTQDRVDLIEVIQLGDEIKVSFNIKGRKWEKDGKTNYFSNLEVWRIEAIKTKDVQGHDNIPEPTVSDIDDIPF